MSWRNEMQRPSFDDRTSGRRQTNGNNSDWQTRLRQLTQEYRSLKKSIEIAKQLSSNQQLSPDIQKNVDDFTGNVEKFLALFVVAKDVLPSEQPSDESVFAKEHGDVRSGFF